MRGRRHTIDAQSPIELPRTLALSLLIVDEGSFLSAPSASPLELHLSAARGLPSWGVIASAIALQAPGAWASCTRYVVVAMYAPSITFITNLDQWETARKAPLDSITRLTILRADTGLPLPAIPGAAEAYASLTQVLRTTRPSQALGLDPRSPVHTRPHSTLHTPMALTTLHPNQQMLQQQLLPMLLPDDEWPALPFFAPIHERRGVDLPILHIPRGRPRPPLQKPLVTAQSQMAVIDSEPSTAETVQQRSAQGAQRHLKAQATPLTSKTSWGNWFTWSP